ncbi:MAG: hypothetical protein JXA30_04190 [Deltaproteobacteria bacterium]|nr:hypothetical protein [Deltaproteobacteria bacterium]
MVLAVPDEPARGRKPVLRDELAAVEVKQQYPPERLRSSFAEKSGQANESEKGRSNTRKSGSEIITTLLERQGVQIVAGIPGSSTLPLYDALRQSAKRHVLARHEKGAGFIAQGMARMSFPSCPRERPITR